MVNRTKTNVLFFSPVQKLRDGHHNLNCAKLKQAKLREPVRVRVSTMLQSLSYLMAGGSSSQTLKLRASANARGQSRKSRFSVTKMTGVQIVRFRVCFLEGHRQPMEVVGAAVRVVGTTVQVWEQLSRNSVCVVCTYTTSLLAGVRANVAATISMHSVDNSRAWETHRHVPRRGIYSFVHCRAGAAGAPEAFNPAPHNVGTTINRGWQPVHADTPAQQAIWGSQPSRLRASRFNCTFEEGKSGLFLFSTCSVIEKQCF